MKFFFLFLMLIFSRLSVATEVRVVTRQNLSFQAESIESSERINETFVAGNTDPVFEKLIICMAHKVADLLPARYLPPRITINIENHAIFSDINGNSESLPLSVFLSTQLPGKNEIRFSNYGISNNYDAARTILAHEMGHMIVEWAWRASGKVPRDQLFGWLWRQSIYEGVADYIAATVNNTSLIGSGPTFWYGRDILKYQTQSDSQKQLLLDTVIEVKNGLRSEGLITQFVTYTKLLADMEDEISKTPKSIDSNAEGTWIAGQLWKMNQKYGSKLVIDSILNLALSGINIKDSQDFLSRVEFRINTLL